MSGSVSPRLRPAVFVVFLATIGWIAGPVAATSGTLLITSDTTLTENHLGPIVVAADDLTLDCAGHIVSGSGFAGILLDGRTGVTIRNCQVTDFTHGVLLLDSSGNTLIRNHARQNDESGIAVVLGSNDNQLRHNRASLNGLIGFLLDGERNVATGNTSTENGNAGFVVGIEATDTSLVGNSSSANGDAGYRFDDSIGNTATGNSATGNGNAGFLLDNSTGNSLIANSSRSNALDGFRLNLSDENQIRDNTASNNGIHGIVLDGSSRNRLQSNVAEANGEDGFALFNESSFNRLTRNRGCGNANFDALDDLTGVGNSWVNNRFCTSTGI